MMFWVIFCCGKRRLCSPEVWVLLGIRRKLSNECIRDWDYRIGEHQADFTFFLLLQFGMIEPKWQIQRAKALHGAEAMKPKVPRAAAKKADAQDA
jgi:hypothetical protein